MYAHGFRWGVAVAGLNSRSRAPECGRAARIRPATATPHRKPLNKSCRPRPALVAHRPRADDGGHGWLRRTGTRQYLGSGFSRTGADTKGRPQPALRASAAQVSSHWHCRTCNPVRASSSNFLRHHRRAICFSGRSSRLLAGTSGAPWDGVALPVYQPRSPADSILYQVVRDHFETFRAHAGGLREGEGLPQFVEQAFHDFLRCGWLGSRTSSRSGANTSDKSRVGPLRKGRERPTMDLLDRAALTARF